MELENIIEQCLLAMLWPVHPKTEAQRRAFCDAVEIQTEYERTRADANVPNGVQSYSASNDVSVSITYSGGRHSGYSRDTLAPGVWEVLFNAGLIRHAWPVARRL